MWIVRLALRRPYTFVVFSLLMFLLGIGTCIEAPKDIYPYIDIPVVTIVWSYSGLPPQEMEGRIVTVCERALSTTVNDIEHTSSESYQGVAVIRVFFQPSVKVELALSQITAVVQTILRVLPPGTYPPNILKYDASSVPIVQLGLSGQGLTEEDLYDLGLSFIRPRLANVEGASVPLPYGGKVRQVQVDADPNLMYAKHLSATDLSTAMNQQNLILPAGVARLGDREFIIKLNSSPPEVSALNDLPVRAANGAVVLMKDVAQVRLGYAPQVNIVREDGKRSALLTVLKNGKTSTLDIVKNVKAALPRIKAGLPPGLQITPLFDQSIFVSESISEVVREATIAAGLTALMILLFLGSWRSTLIVCASIPLSIATSLVILYALQQTINVMTLGGLALAVGILVDDATVEIENTHRNMSEKKPLVRAILDSAQQVAAPAFVSTLSICLVFTPVVLLSGAARYLFTPLAMAVVFAMMASYFLSRTLVPTQRAVVASAERNVESYRANLARVIALQGYERVTAPFTGVVTQRNTDVGALIGASGAASAAPMSGSTSTSTGGSANVGSVNTGGVSGTPSGAATPTTAGAQGGAIFAVAQMDTLRILVSVPEGYASSVKKGMPAKVFVQERANKPIDGRVARTADELDQNTRTMLVEVDVDNRDGSLYPGMYAVVSFVQVRGVSPLTVPGDAVVVRQDKNMVAVVRDETIAMVPVEIGRDYGPSVEILNGLSEGDMVVTTVTDAVQPGVKVHAKQSRQAGEDASGQGGAQQDKSPGSGPSQYGDQSIVNSKSESTNQQKGGQQKTGQEKGGQQQKDGTR